MAPSFYFVFKPQVLFSRRDLNWLTVIIPIIIKYATCFISINLLNSHNNPARYM